MTLILILNRTLNHNSISIITIKIYLMVDRIIIIIYKITKLAKVNLIIKIIKITLI